MATKIYNSKTIKVLNDTEIHLTPLKIKYLRQFMDEFENMNNASNDLEATEVLVKCAHVAMKQYYSNDITLEETEDLLDMYMVYEILDYGANIKINKKNENEVKNENINDEETIQQKSIDGEKSSGWSDLDLAKLEAEVFLLGIWKDYQDLEESLSMPELMATLSSSRELDFEEKKFLAAMQGVDLGSTSEKSNEKVRGQQEWEDLKARVFSKGKTGNANDILSLQGANAAKAGFGIGMGLDYEDLTQK